MPFGVLLTVENQQPIQPSPLKDYFERKRSANQKSPSGLSIEEMGKRIAEFKRPKAHFFCNPLNGNSLF